MIEAVFSQAKFMRALKSRSFAYLWMGQIISGVGDAVFVIALAWQVLILTGSATAMGVLLIARTLPMVLFLPFGGVMADRLPRYLVMLWSDAGRALVVLLIAGLGWFHQLQFWHLIVLALIFGIVDSFFTPAYQSIAPQLVETDDLPSANALAGISQQISQLAGPLLGALCVALLGTASAFTFDGLTFIFSAFCLMTIGPAIAPALEAQLTEPGAEPLLVAQLAEPVQQPRFVLYMRNVLVDIREGFTYIIGSTWLWVSIVVAAFANMAESGAVFVALPKLILNVYGSGVWLLGTLTTIFAIGVMIGAFGVGQRLRMKRRGMLAYTALLIFGIGLGAFGLPLPRVILPAVACCASLLLGFGLGVYSVIWLTVMQELIPGEKLGRVTSIDVLLSNILQPIGYVIAGVVADRSSPALVFLAGGILCVVLAGASFTVPGIRRVQ